MVDVDGNPVSTKHNILGEADDVAVLTLDTLIDLKKQMLAGSEQCINVTYDPQCTGVDEIVMMIEAEIARYDIPEYSPALRVAIESCLPTLGTNDDVYVGAYGDQSMTNILIPSVENTYKLASLAAGYLGRRATTSMNDLIREKHGLTYGIHFYHTLTFNKNYDSFVCDVSPGDEALLLSLITESIDASVAGFTSEKWDGVLQTIRNERILANMNLNSYDDLIVTGYMHPTVYAGYADVFEVNIDAAIESIYTDEYTFENIRDGIENIQANYQNKTIIRSWE
jgi:predicted Zn-dependent peptidase